MGLSRRGILTGLVGLVAAPAIVRYANLMPVRGIVMPAGGFQIANLADVSDTILRFDGTHVLTHYSGGLCWHTGANWEAVED